MYYVWGIKLYQNDISISIKGKYGFKLKLEKTSEEATEELVDEFSDLLKYDDVKPLFWIALADIQWSYGRLIPEVKEKALYYIKEKAFLNIFDIKNRLITDKCIIPDLRDKKNLNYIDDMLNELNIKLNSPMPQKKAIRPWHVRKLKLKIGDIVAYKLENGKYIALKVVAEALLPSHGYYLQPEEVLLAYDFCEDKIPTLEELKNIDFVKDKNGEYFKVSLIYSNRTFKEFGFVYLGNDTTDTCSENVSCVGFSSCTPAALTGIIRLFNNKQKK